MEGSTKTPVIINYASTKAMELCQQENCQYFTSCDCDASSMYLDLWPFHGSTHTVCQTGDKLHQACLGSLGPNALGERWCEIHRCRFNHARFERKQDKNIAKRLKREGERPLSSICQALGPVDPSLKKNLLGECNSHIIRQRRFYESLSSYSFTPMKLYHSFHLLLTSESIPAKHFRHTFPSSNWRILSMRA